MRKFVILLLTILCTVVSWYSLKTNDKNCFEVIKVNSADDFFVDFNHSKSFEANERVMLYDVISKNDVLSQEDFARIEYLSKNFAKTTLLHKKVCVKDRENFSDLKTESGKNYLKLLAEKGFVVEENNKDTVLKNINFTKTLDLVSYNSVSQKFHKLGCKHAFLSKNSVVMMKSELPKESIPCGFCYVKNETKYEDEKRNINNNKHEIYPKEYFEKYAPTYKDGFVEFFVTDYTKQYFPSKKCLTSASQALLREINSAQKSIDFAIYGIDKQPQITEALMRAKNRGVKIRWVFDVDKDGNSIYKENFSLRKSLADAKSDVELADKGRTSNGELIRDSIMHNKFFIFDEKKVWTGSANISHTDLSGFNANTAILINSSEIASLYKQEFEKMYSGKFHQLKTPTEENATCVGVSKISVYFSPQDKIATNHLIPIINNAKNYIYIPVFVITHKDFVQALINAHNRGVDVKVIVDATSASSKSSSVRDLRNAGIKVKTENRAGKMHMKSILVDDKYSVVGSMNFTKSGERYNDENVLIIENPVLTKNFKAKFVYFYNDIPEKWLSKNPSAESLNSINSCFDGIDNDFDGKIDGEDEGCHYIKK